jgi:manganese transport protein
VTMIPALAVAGMGMSATKALVLSQVMLSFALPVPMIAVLVLSSSRQVMRQFANSAATIALGVVAAAAVLALNCVLLYEAFATL